MVREAAAAAPKRQAAATISKSTQEMLPFRVRAALVAGLKRPVAMDPRANSNADRTDACAEAA